MNEYTANKELAHSASIRRDALARDRLTPKAARLAASIAETQQLLTKLEAIDDLPASSQVEITRRNNIAYCRTLLRKMRAEFTDAIINKL